jgi:hypothetical protein
MTDFSELVTASSIVLSSVPKALAFFFFIGLPDPMDDKWRAFIEDDGFNQKTLNDHSKAGYFLELMNVKKQFSDFLESNDHMNQLIGHKGGALLVEAYIIAFAIRIKKIRLVIQPTFYTTTMTKGKFQYVVMKTSWIDVNGKYVKKFTKLLGRLTEVKTNGKIPSRLIQQSEENLSKTMWKQYQKEYYPETVKE